MLHRRIERGGNGKGGKIDKIGKGKDKLLGLRVMKVKRQE
jgi:hypothetical protein